MMQMGRLQTRFVVSGLVAVVLLACFIAITVGERSDYNAQQEQLKRDHHAALHAGELRVYSQYAAHDTNAYLLGHLEHGDEFTTHVAAFDAALTVLEQQAAAGLLDADTAGRLSEIRQLRTTYVAATDQLFRTADAWRAAPSPATQAAMDAAWANADGLEHQLDIAAETTAEDFIADAERLELALTMRGQQVLWTNAAVGGVIALVILGTQLLSARAVGRPIMQLIGGVQRFSAGDYTARVDGQRSDEIGDLGRTFNHLADTIQQQTTQLADQYAVADAARVDAELARAETAEQLATIRQQETVIREMSVPILPLDADTLVLPLIGALDTGRLQDMQTQALETLQQTKARRLLLDITGVPLIDTFVAQGMLRLVQAARLLGAEVTLIGVRPEVAQAMVALGVDLPHLRSARDLQTVLHPEPTARGWG